MNRVRRLLNATLPTVRNCVTDFGPQIAARCPGVPPTRSKRDDFHHYCKPLMSSPSGPPANIRRGARWTSANRAAVKALFALQFEQLALVIARMAAVFGEQRLHLTVAAAGVDHLVLHEGRQADEVPPPQPDVGTRLAIPCEQRPAVGDIRQAAPRQVYSLIRMPTVEQEHAALQIAQLLGCRGGGHDEEPAMRRAVATRHRIARVPSRTAWPASIVSSGITAGLRKEHLGAHPGPEPAAVRSSALREDRATPPLSSSHAAPPSKRALTARISGRLYIGQARSWRHGAASIAARTRSGVNGICVTLTPTASSMASRDCTRNPEHTRFPDALLKTGRGRHAPERMIRIGWGRSLASGTR